jgi:UDP-N-acetylglucosamine--N-acetylmuramyl-(pentapeptide) pyrophosphoryl-undecaprenol N-acetylglucosamine transferase
MGGYVSLPVCVAARAVRIPVVLHEQNIVFGLANRVCKVFAHRVAVSFEDTLEAAGARGVFVGNPVGADMRPDVREACRPQGIARFDLDPARPTLLIFGGSQGARRLNEAAAGLARRWLHRPDRQVVHITGGSSQHADPGELSGGELIWRSVPFVERMVEAYAVADLALCRGGATTVAELTAVGVAAVVVPYPYHRDRQQELHGIVLQRAGAGIVLPDREATVERVAAETDALLGAPERLDDMRRAARALGVPDAAERLATVVREAAA